MHRIATRIDWNQLSPEQRAAHAAVLAACQLHKLSCRCEVVDSRDFAITIAPGLSSAKYWIDRLDVDVTT